MCCVCAGSCSHIGPHSYCPAHGGTTFYPAVAPAPSTAPLPPAPWTWAPPPCEHCFCKKAAYSPGDGPHRQCCKCGTAMAEQFIPGLG